MKSCQSHCVIHVTGTSTRGEQQWSKAINSSTDTAKFVTVHGTSPVEKRLCLWICLTLPVLKLLLFTNSAQSLCGMSTFAPKQNQIPTQYSTKKWNWSGTEAQLRKTKKPHQNRCPQDRETCRRTKGWSLPSLSKPPRTTRCRPPCAAGSLPAEAQRSKMRSAGKKATSRHSVLRSQPPRNPPGRFPCPPPRPAARRSAPPRTEPRWGTWRGEPTPPPHTHTHTSASLG